MLNHMASFVQTTFSPSKTFRKILLLAIRPLGPVPNFRTRTLGRIFPLFSFFFLFRRAPWKGEGEGPWILQHRRNLEQLQPLGNGTQYLGEKGKKRPR